MHVLIVDDHPISSQGLATLVADALDAAMITEAHTGPEALAAAAADPPGLILLDLRIAGVPDTAVLCAQLHAGAPRAKIALVTAFDDPATIRQCFAAGADACLLKDSPIPDLSASLQAVTAGRRVIDPRIAQTLAAEHVRMLRGDHDDSQLTPRERQVLALLAEGCSNGLIAERLFIAETTVKGYVSSLLQKLDASSRLQAVLHASERGML